MKNALRLPRDWKALEARRLQAAKLFLQGHPQAEIVRRFGVSRPTAHAWYQVWKRHGTNGLKSVGRLGRKPRLDASARQRLQQALLQGPQHWGFCTDLWTLERIATVISKTCRVHYHPRHVWRLLQSLGWSRQRPARRAREADPQGIAGWVCGRWPQVKKTPAV
jgi:transposase